ncbi:unnamed protein product [Schistosoma turkestanicum]|nr:unnamed protein product [Schistosoma turkestanicum]
MRIYSNLFIKITSSIYYYLTYSLSPTSSSSSSSSYVFTSRTSSSPSSSFICSFYLIFSLINKFLLQHYVEAVQGCSIFYESDFKWKKALCDSETNKLNQIPIDLPINLIELRILHQSIVKIKRNSLNHLIHLETIQIESSQVKQIESDTFRQLISLKYINLRNNSLKIGSKGFPVELLLDLPNLRSLNLAENPIDLIPDAFFDNLHGSKLQYLWLNSVKSNGITFESNLLKPLTYLRLLDLSNTGLTSLHMSSQLALNNMNDLKEFYIGGNPWLCDCKLSWLKVWFLQKSSKNLQFKQNKTDHHGNVEINEPICFKPDKLKGKRLFSTDNQYTSVQFSDLHCTPQIFTSSQNFTFHYGKTMLLRCEYHSNKIDHLLWYKDNQLVQNTSQQTIIYGQLGSNFYSNLFISSASGEHTGLWSCLLNDQYRTVFGVNILNADGKILYPSDENSLMHGAFVLLGIRGETKNWIYAGIAMVILFVILALIGIGIFCCCEPHSRSLDTSTDSQTVDGVNKKNCSLHKSGSVCRCRFKCVDGSRHNHHHHRNVNNKRKNNVSKDDSVSSLLITTNDEQKIVEKNELQLTNHVKDDAVCVNANNNNSNHTQVTTTTMTTTTTTMTSLDVNMNNTETGVSTSPKRNVETNRLLNIFCCPTNATREVQLVTIPTLNTPPSSSSSPNDTHLAGGASLIQGTVTNCENRVLVTCDSPEPKLLIATNGIKPSSNISSLNFSTCLQPQQQQPLNMIPQQTFTEWNNTNCCYPTTEFSGIYTSTHQISIETSKPCPVHGMMKLKQMELNYDTVPNTTIDNNNSMKPLSNYPKIDSIYWDHSNSTAILTNPHISYNLPNCILLNSHHQNGIINGDEQNHTKTLPLQHINNNNNNHEYNLLQNSNIQWSADLQSCPVHGNQTLTRKNNNSLMKKHSDKIPAELENYKILKTKNHFNKTHDELLNNQVASISSCCSSVSSDINDQETTVNKHQSTSIHNHQYRPSLSSMKTTEQIIPTTTTTTTTTDETQSSQDESSVTEKSSSIHSDCVSHNSSSSSSSTNHSIVSVNQHFKYMYPTNQTGYNSICSSLSNQINLATGVAMNPTTTDRIQQQSPPSLEFCPSPELNNSTSQLRSRNAYSLLLNHLKCPVHSLTMNRRRSITSKLFYDAYNHRENMRQYYNHDHHNKSSSSNNNNNSNSNSIGTLRVTTLPTRFRKVNYNFTNNDNNSNSNSSGSSSGSGNHHNHNHSNNILNNLTSIRKFASQHTIQSNDYYASALCLSHAQSFDNPSNHNSRTPTLLRPGSKHKLEDTDSDSDNNYNHNNGNTFDENHFQL